MPTLNEYIGSLVSSITNARVMSDIQTVKVAEEYAKHDLLKHFSVPRMRIGDVEMTIPVALEEFNEKDEVKIAPLNHDKINTIVYKEMVSKLGLEKLQRTQITALKAEIAGLTSKLEQNISLSNDLTPLKRYSEKLVSHFDDMIRKNPTLINDTGRKINIEALPEYLEVLLSKEIEIVTQKKSIGNLSVIAESFRLKEQKPENLLYIKMKISEEGMEWNFSENSKGEIENRLIPE